MLRGRLGRGALILVVFGVACSGTAGVLDVKEDTGDNEAAALCPTGTRRSQGERDILGFVYGGEGDVGLEGVRVSPCGASDPVALSDSEGNWSLSVDDREWITIDQTHDEFVPNHCVFDPSVEGIENFPYRIGMGGWDTENFPMAFLGVEPEPGLSWVDVDALDDGTGYDLAGATIDITAPYEAAITQDLDGNFMLGNVTNGVYDILFANVSLVPFEVVVSHPEKPTCRIPSAMLGRGNDQLNLSVYCR